MVELEQQKLRSIGNSLGIIIPKKLRDKYRWTSDEPVDLVVTESMLVLLGREIDFDIDMLKRELDLAQKKWDEREDRELLKWFKTLTSEERERIKKNKELLTGKFDKSQGVMV